MEITINIPGLSDLAASIVALAQAMNGQASNGEPSPGTHSPNLTLVHQQPSSVPVTPPAADQPQAAPQAPPQHQAIQQAPAGVPTASQTYTMEQLAVAATQLMDAGKRADLVTLLGRFGVQALTALPKEQYGTFATELRAMGAKL